MRELLGPDVLAQLPPDHAANLTGKTFFPQLISGPFHDGLVVVFLAAAVMCVAGALMSLVKPGAAADVRPGPSGGATAAARRC